MDERERALLKGLVQLVWADGELAEAESVALGQLLVELGCSPAEIQEVGRMLVQPPELADLRQELRDSQSREDVMRLLLAMSMADGRVDPSELGFLDRLAGHLEIPPSTMEALKAQVFQSESEEA